MTFEEIDLNDSNIGGVGGIGNELSFIKTCQCGNNEFDNSESKKSRLLFFIGHFILVTHFINIPKLWSNNNDTSKRYAIGSLCWISLSLFIFLYIYIIIGINNNN